MLLFVFATLCVACVIIGRPALQILAPSFARKT
jgi:hypothetical protein